MNRRQLLGTVLGGAAGAAAYAANASAEQELVDLLEKRVEVKKRLAMLAEAELYRNDFAAFAKAAWHLIEPGKHFDWNWHHDAICGILQKCAEGIYKRVIFNIPPRHTKSILVNVLYPVWVWTRQPGHQFLTLSHSQDLAVRDAVKGRRICESKWFQERFCGPTSETAFRFRPDQNAKANYENTQGGHRNSQGIQGAITGKGGDTIIIDDPHKTQDVRSDAERMAVLNTYDDTVESRLNDQATGCIILIMQRLHEADLTGHLLAKDGGKDDWLHICFPQEFEPEHPHLSELDPRTVPGELLWPSRMTQEVAARQKRNLGEFAYSGQYQQRPTPAGGGIIRKEWWAPWNSSTPPKCEYVVDSWDTAFSEKDIETNARSAMTRWGVFWHPQAERYCMILIWAWADWVSYPILRRNAQSFYEEQRPDAVLVEKKASGQSLIQDLRMAGVPVHAFQPDRDKVARAYSVSAMFESGQIYAPLGRQWAQMTREECASFPFGALADLVDSTTQALIHCRNRLLVPHPDNPVHEPIIRAADEDRQPLYG